jgi:hypothetical protein
MQASLRAVATFACSMSSLARIHLYKVFSGNPAAVCILDKWIDETKLN